MSSQIESPSGALYSNVARVARARWLVIDPALVFFGNTGFLAQQGDQVLVQIVFANGISFVGKEILDRGPRLAITA